MKLLSFKFTLESMLQCVSFSLLWIVADCNNMLEIETTNKTELTLMEGASVPPADVRQVNVVRQNEYSITLEWDKVDNILTYRLKMNESYALNVTANVDDVVHYVVPGLTAGTRYNFTLYTVSTGISSSGYSFTAVTAPSDAETFEHITQNDTSITLQWTKVGDINSYTLSYNGKEVSITHSEGNGKYTVPDLTSGTRYSFTLYTLFDYTRSRGKIHTAVTVPSQVSSVSVTERFEDRVTLQWDNQNKDWKYQLKVNDIDTEINQNDHNIVSHSVTDLKPGTKYSFSITTIFFGLLSTPYSGDTVTKINCSSVTWHVTNSSIKGTVEGLFSKATASYNSNTHDSPEGKKVSFTGLYPGATYEISLKYNLASTDLTQCSIKIPIIPPSVTADCSYWASGYGAKINMESPNGVLTAVEVTINKKKFTINETDIKTGLIVKGLQPAKRYEVSLVSQLEAENLIRRSEPSVFFCSTDNRGVIAGSLVGVLLFVVLICVIVFIVIKRPDFIRRKKSFLSRSQRSESKIFVVEFPKHFYLLGLDENRGFSQEYEGLASVGTKQTCKAAVLPENREKNRFNILPYDWCRVKLNTSTPNETSDYINASYIPGYSSNSEYIATQGPLPSTVRDFWRMVWEQRVKCIVMVTNCIEGGRTKCEQYWPERTKSLHYGDVFVTGVSELKQPKWTQREFRLKNRSSSVETTVKHFHFTVWPDRGVPQSTEALIRFRGIIRWHIERDRSEGPTLVHCSDGVGRTGTFIALDVLLQQVEREQAVSIKDFLHKMRKHRPHMVQTESQYVFLHQCILDSLQPHVTQEDHIYENDDDLIYQNTIPLQELP